MRKTAILVMMLLIGILTFNPSALAKKATFSDVPTTHYAFDPIEWAYDFEIINGYPDGKFRPNQAVTEQQFASILVRYFELEPVIDELEKYSNKESASDANYNTLAAHQVPLNGYFDNSIRERPVKRGVVAQALTHIIDGNATLNHSINFLVDHSISNGQNPKYEQTNLAKFFGAPNNLTRAQAVTLFYNIQNKSLFYLSQDAVDSFANVDSLELYKRANLARQKVAASLRSGSDWVPLSKGKDSWDGDYRYFYQYGRGDTDSVGRNISISLSSNKNFYVVYDTFDGFNEGSVQGYATVVSPTQAMMTETIEGDRCIIEFQKQATSIKTIEHNCAKFRDAGTDYSGILRKY